jgi:hypothetical protein
LQLPEGAGIGLVRELIVGERGNGRLHVTGGIGSLIDSSGDLLRWPGGRGAKVARALPQGDAADNGGKGSACETKIDALGGALGGVQKSAHRMASVEREEKFAVVEYQTRWPAGIATTGKRMLAGAGLQDRDGKVGQEFGSGKVAIAERKRLAGEGAGGGSKIIRG